MKLAELLEKCEDIGVLDLGHSAMVADVEIGVRYPNDDQNWSAYLAVTVGGTEHEVVLE
jgi:hypothetical protein